MIYAIEALLDDRNRLLYEELSQRVTFTFENAPGTAWGVRYDAERELAEMICSVCADPIAAFTHELLHVRFEINGYLKPEQAFKVANDTYRHRVNAFRSTAYNALMHVKMYPDFLALGFTPEQFFLERNPPSQLQQLVKECKTDIDECGSARERKLIATESFIRSFFMLSAPSIEAAQCLKSLKRLDPVAFDHLSQYLSGWLTAEPGALCWHLARLFYMCGHYDVGIGYKGTPPIWAANTK